LANLYFVFALNEALVLRATNDRAVWKTFLLGLLIADFGHLYSVKAVGVEVYWRFWEWNAMQVFLGYNTTETFANHTQQLLGTGAILALCMLGP
jgi:hypothetical protein